MKQKGRDHDGGVVKLIEFDSDPGRGLLGMPVGGARPGWDPREWSRLKASAALSFLTVDLT